MVLRARAKAMLNLWGLWRDDASLSEVGLPLGLRSERGETAGQGANILDADGRVRGGLYERGRLMGTPSARCEGHSIVSPGQ